jgi:hypothetical protein
MEEITKSDEVCWNCRHCGQLLSGLTPMLYCTADRRLVNPSDECRYGIFINKYEND